MKNKSILHHLRPSLNNGTNKVCCSNIHINHHDKMWIYNTGIISLMFIAPDFTTDFTQYHSRDGLQSASNQPRSNANFLHFGRIRRPSPVCHTERASEALINTTLKCGL